MITAGEVISYLDMCQEEGVNLQRGMNYRLKPNYSIILMSIRKGAPYNDRVEDNGRILIYEGHDAPKKKDGPEPKTTDQPMNNPRGGLTQNGLFYQAAMGFKNSISKPELVKVYEKIHSGIWVFNGVFTLVDAWLERHDNRQVFKFKLKLHSSDETDLSEDQAILRHNRIIPSSVKLEVWKRDQGKCVKCGSRVNLHFDHIIPFSKGGTSLRAENIQLLCAQHNIEKRDQIE